MLALDYSSERVTLRKNLRLTPRGVTPCKRERKCVIARYHGHRRAFPFLAKEAGARAKLKARRSMERLSSTGTTTESPFKRGDSCPKLTLKNVVGSQSPLSLQFIDE